MNVSKIRLIGLYTIDLPLVVAQPSDSFIVKAADGLGPTPAAVSVPNSAGIGGVYQGRRAENRDLVFRIGLNPNYKLFETAAGLREELYGLFTPDSEDDSVLVQFLQGPTVVAQTRGWVSAMESVQFTKEPEVQVTIDTAWPYLEAPSPLTVVPTTKGTFTIPNTGTAPTGFSGEFIFTADRSSWQLNLGNKFMKFVYDFKSGDILRFNSRAKSRSITRVRNGVELDLLFSLSPGSTWLELRGGDNNFVSNTTLFNWGYIRYTPQYLGV